jgi:hypothetical protein
LDRVEREDLELLQARVEIAQMRKDQSVINKELAKFMIA